MGKLLALSAKAGVAYAVTVFAIGFLLGTARILLLAPTRGLNNSRLGRGAHHFDGKLLPIEHMDEALRGRCRNPHALGAVAFVTLTILEVALSISLFYQSIGEYIADLRSPAGVVGLAAQACFATFPLLNVVVRRRLDLSGYAS